MKRKLREQAKSYDLNFVLVVQPGLQGKHNNPSTHSEWVPSGTQDQLRVMQLL